MGTKYHLDVNYEVPKKLSWYYAPFLASFWLILYFAASVTSINYLPEPLTINDEQRGAEGSFIAERAAEIHVKLALIGPKVVGSYANEVTAVEFLKAEIDKVRQQMSDYFELEVDVQVASGNYIHWSMVNMYQSIQNVVVKLSAKGSTSDNYLLINAHYDSVPGSPGAGDDGAMVSVMLEVMRVIAKSEGPLKHPIVFLFNGAEENPLQASHAFITQHKWAKNCKALVNLDSAGSGGREILFQSGPNHPWIMRYYHKVPHPFTTSMGEEIFQANFIPSDTDFRIFRDFGDVPGLDMAYVFNGYVYHTKYDRVNIFPKASLQNTGDNVLCLAKSIANAPEMDDTSQYKEGHAIFYDFLGWFMIIYTQTVGNIINVVVCVVALIAIGVSLFFMSARSGLNWAGIMRRYGITLAIHIVSLIMAVGLPLLVAVFMDSVYRSLSWFSANWLLIGLYFSPIFFGLGILQAFYLEKTKKDALSLGFKIQLFMHAHCFCLVILTIAMTILGVRSSFMPMMAVMFETLALIINLITKWHTKAYWFAIAAIVCQILPFLYFTYMAQVLYFTMMPMKGRSGAESNPDLGMAGIAIFLSIFYAGFVTPVFMIFRKTRTIITCFLGVTILFMIIAATPAGFPFREKTATQRYNLLHAHRVLHNADNSIRIDEAGIYVFPQDRRIDIADKYIEAIGEKHKASEYCDTEMFCGMPLYNHRWHKEREYSFWIPIEERPNIPGNYPELNLTSVNNLDESGAMARRRYDFVLSGPGHMTIFIGLQGNTKIVDWSFNKTMIRDNWQAPYFIYFSYGKDDTPLEFYIDIEKPISNMETPTLEIGVGGHWIYQNKNRTSKYEEFVVSFPDYATIDDWVATYESWIF